MNETLEPKLQTYVGTVELSKIAKPHGVLGLAKFAHEAWPDVKLPGDFVIMPLEDYRILIADAVGQIMTPKRNAFCLRVSQSAVPKPSWYWPLIFSAVWIGLDLLRRLFT